MFGKEQLGYFLPLALFSNMTSLNICGGDFYSDKLIDLLEQIGQRLMHGKIVMINRPGERLEELDIYAVGEVDMKGVAMLTVYCRSVCSISFFIFLLISQSFFPSPSSSYF